MKPGENNPHQSVHVLLEHMNVTLTNVVIVLQTVKPVLELEITVSPVTQDMTTNHPFVHVPLTCTKNSKSVMLVTHYVPHVLVLPMVTIIPKPDLAVPVSSKLTEDKTHQFVPVLMDSMLMKPLPHLSVEDVILNVEPVHNTKPVLPVLKTLEDFYQDVIAQKEPSLKPIPIDVDHVLLNVELVVIILPIIVEYVKLKTLELKEPQQLGLPLVHVLMDTMKD